jgi:hypothetical protein
MGAQILDLMALRLKMFDESLFNFESGMISAD